jgi:hypothetical protein
MSSGQQTTNELDKRNITVKLSFNEIKKILFNFRNFQYSSTEGQISVLLVESMKTHLERKVKQGKLPPELAEFVLDDSEDSCEQQQ